MIILALDTSTPATSVAIRQRGQTVWQTVVHDDQHSSAVVSTIAAGLHALGLSPSHVERVGVGRGPGSFTGLRIGMATAKGLAFAIPAPMVPVSSLAALAVDAMQRHPDAHRWAVAMDARRGEVFVGVYEQQGSRLLPVQPEAVMAPLAFAELASGLGPEVRSVGNALLRYPAELAALRERWLGDLLAPSGAAIAELAAQVPEAELAAASDEPAYLRLAEAEIMYPDGVPGAFGRKV